ncbi:MAG: bifunctional homocysteine S-methyltransferase/methylenetetrahydrofolate reductase [Sedimentisphaerales bacterium]|nr:bifunctional homocysteine S-methyltransferase/methylenetetrahydrofolate reductase [Sedimentisphaerales bacterium]
MISTKEFNEILAQKVLLADGAMGTMLYQHGIFLNSCFDEVNLGKPELVKKIHKAYVDAGADFIETNTFGANSFKLAKFGLQDKVEQINKTAVEIARDCVGSDVMVAGSVGPIGRQLSQYEGDESDEDRKFFSEQADALIRAGVDFIILETFRNTWEISAAIETILDKYDIAIVAQMTVDSVDETIFRDTVTSAIKPICGMNVSAVGLNCSVGPSDMLTGLELIRKITDKPISVQPNAGLPRQFDGRTLYMSTPEYMAEYAKRFFEKGARIIGGCCGTTPEHIREIVRVVRPLDKASIKSKERPVVVISEPPAGKPQREEIPLSEKSKIGKKIAQRQKVFSIEITSPLGIDINKTLEKAQICAESRIDAVNIPDGPRASSRLSPMATCVKIQQYCKIETILHFCCRDRNLIGMQADLLGAHVMDLRNILVITGDPPKLGQYPDATGVFDMDSIALTSVIKNLNRGYDIAGNDLSSQLALTIGVGANPVATELDREVERFRRKVAAGAEYAITQPVFDVDMLLNFLEMIESFRIPIIAGIWPFTSYKNAEFMANEVPGVVVPEKLLERMYAAKTKEQGRSIGIEIAQEMVQKLGDYVDGFAVSAPFGNVKTALTVLGKK